MISRIQFIPGSKRPGEVQSTSDGYNDIFQSWASHGWSGAGVLYAGSNHPSCRDEACLQRDCPWVSALTYALQIRRSAVMSAATTERLDRPVRQHEKRCSCSSVQGISGPHLDQVTRPLFSFPWDMHEMHEMRALDITSISARAGIRTCASDFWLQLA